MPRADREIDDALRDLAPITQAVKQALLLVVHPSFPAKSVKELIAIAKNQPGTINYSSPGFGANPQMGMELFLYMAGVKLYHVPYRGGGESIIAAVSGHVPTTVASVAGTIAQVRAGRLRALGVTTATRIPSALEIPTIAEAGVPGYESTQWYGLVAPAGLPRDITMRVHKEATTIFRLPEIVARLANEGSQVVASTPEEFGAFMRVETEKWARVAKAAGIKPA